MCEQTICDECKHIGSSIFNIHAPFCSKHYTNVNKDKYSAIEVNFINGSNLSFEGWFLHELYKDGCFSCKDIEGNCYTIHSNNVLYTICKEVSECKG